MLASNLTRDLAQSLCLPTYTILGCMGAFYFEQIIEGYFQDPSDGKVARKVNSKGLRPVKNFPNRKIIQHLSSSMTAVFCGPSFTKCSWAEFALDGPASCTIHELECIHYINERNLHFPCHFL